MFLCIESAEHLKFLTSVFSGFISCFVEVLRQDPSVVKSSFELHYIWSFEKSRVNIEKVLKTATKVSIWDLKQNES